MFSVQTNGCRVMTTTTTTITRDRNRAGRFCSAADSARYDVRKPPPRNDVHGATTLVRLRYVVTRTKRSNANGAVSIVSNRCARKYLIVYWIYK